MFGYVVAVMLMASGVSTDPRLAPRPPEQVMAIPEPMRRELRERVLLRSSGRERRMVVLTDYLFKPDGLGIRYQSDATYTVSEAYQTRKANCLTFTLLTVALAREVGLEAYGQDVAEAIVWQQDEQAVYQINHVNAGFRLGSRRYTVDVASDEVSNHHPPGRIGDSRLLAMYYNNRAAELMVQDQPEAAMAHVRMSLTLDPHYPSAWSNAGVLHGRKAEFAEAERAYRHALHLEPMHASALTNLVAHYEQAGAASQAQALRARLKQAQRRNPYHQFMRAREYERAGQLRLAQQHYARAIRLHKTEHRFHFGLARASFLLGELQEAQKWLTSARELSSGDARDRYEAKINALNGLAVHQPRRLN